MTPVFAPPQETGFQAAIESFNGHWQTKVWERFHHNSLADLQARSLRYIQAHRRRSATRIEAAPIRMHFPAQWRWDDRAPLNGGSIIYIRRTNDHGQVSTSAIVSMFNPHGLIDWSAVRSISTLIPSISSP